MRWSFRGDDGQDLAVDRRKHMVEQQIRQRGIVDERVLKAMETVPREAFMPHDMQDLAYADGAMPIGRGQTISQPFVVAAMTEALQLEPGMRILEVGTGSGYQAAVLSEMGAEVYTIEFNPDLAREARARMEQLGYEHLHYMCGDGNLGWPEEAPFDGIIVTAAPPVLPGALGEQLKPGGRLVIPVGRVEQDLRVYRKNDDGSLERHTLFAVRFVPLVSQG